MDNKKIITVMTSMTIALSLGVLAPERAQAQTSSYHSGDYWSYTDPDHTNELHNGSVPFAVDTARLSANLNLASGTTINDIYADIESAITELDSTDLNIVRKDTLTPHHDNKITSNDLRPKSIAEANSKLIHFKIDGWNTGWDHHLLRAQIVLNDDSNDFTWDHDGGDSKSNTLHTYNIVIHELGHAVGLCDTYQTSTTKNKGSCTGVVDTTSIMSNSGLYQSAHRSLTATDTATLNRVY